MKPYYKNELTTIYNGDCLEVMDYLIEQGIKVDAIITDPPYGIMKDITQDGIDGMDWDTALNPMDIFIKTNKLLKKNGKLILFSQEPYTTKLVNSVLPNLPFKYRMVWEKDDFANALLCNKAPVSYYEDILVFSKTHETNGKHPLHDWLVKIQKQKKWNDKELINLYVSKGYSKNVASASATLQHLLDWKYNQIGVINEKHYDILKNYFNFDETLEYLNSIYTKYKNNNKSVYNLWQGEKYKSNILKYKKDYDGYHPTQKPILLLEDLIKTYSNENNTILDFTMGSGSTGVACFYANRKFIGIELSKEYCDIGIKRLESLQMRLDI